jgi:hypothetical protein
LTDGVEIDRAGVDLGWTRQVEQAVDDLRGAEGLPLDLLQDLGARVFRLGLLQQHLREARDAGERRVDLVRTPAASRPIDAIFSEICSCSSSCTRLEMSSMTRMVPATAPSESRSGVVATLTSSRRDVSWRVGSGTR